MFLQKFKSQNSFSFLKGNTAKKAFVFLAADYGNLGDVAITYAQTQFLKNSLQGYEVIDVPISKTLEGISMIKKTIKNSDIVTTVGGGNFGDLYDQIEFYRQLVVESFPNNKVVSFPQTMDFSNSEKGKKALMQAKKCYSKHKNMIFIAREQMSFNMMQDNFTNNTIILTPDIVMSLNKMKPELERKGVVLCLRDDDEKLLKPNEKAKLLELVDENFEVKSNYDTHINKNNLSIEERIDELDKIWTAFKKAELVITDRLHGMIFCYITKTPCLVFQNNNHKVKGSYQWIKDKSNIKLIDNFSESEINDFLKNQEFSELNFQTLKHDFNVLTNLLNS
ncbi:polysaccharide pyruvyl transferase family protein [Flavobacterium ponti]|uniref:Polysaccharide pyruvyl transferase family protein n=1 Tax=Flavobacterium ponti TaxID=665133 RepID=A0ABV9P1V1_9FLAO